MPIPQNSPYGELQCSKAQILQTLREWMTVMQLLPGEKISDTEIAEYFNVSRTPVREALKILEQQRLICTYPGKATVVAELELDKIEDYYVPMQTLQCLATRLAVNNASEEDIEELESLNRVFMEVGERNAKELLLADKAFHQKIIDIAGNKYIDEFCESLWVHIARLDYLFFRDNYMDSSYTDHVNIINSMRLRDPFGAEIAMKNNWNYSMLAVKVLAQKNHHD